MGRQIQSEQKTLKAGEELPVFTEFDYFRIKSITGATSVMVAIGENGGLFEEWEAGRLVRLENPVNELKFKNTAAVPVTVVFLALLGAQDDEGNITLSPGAVVKIDDATPVSVTTKKTANSTVKGTITGGAVASVTMQKESVIYNNGPESIWLKLGAGSDYIPIQPNEKFILPFDGSVTVKNMGSLTTTYIRMI